MESQPPLDNTDLQILAILQSRGRITNAQLAREVGLSPPSVLERVRKLEDRGVITRYVALLDPTAVGLGMAAFVLVSLAYHRKHELDQFRAAMLELDQVLECHHVSGEGDFLIKVQVSDIEGYRRFLVNTLTPMEGVQRVRTMIVFETIKHESRLPLPTP